MELPEFPQALFSDDYESNPKNLIIRRNDFVFAASLRRLEVGCPGSLRTCPPFTVQPEKSAGNDFSSKKFLIVQYRSGLGFRECHIYVRECASLLLAFTTVDVGLNCLAFACFLRLFWPTLHGSVPNAK